MANTSFSLELDQTWQKQKAPRLRLIYVCWLWQWKTSKKLLSWCVLSTLAIFISNESFRSIYLLFSLALICSVPLQEIQKESKTYWLQKWLKNYWWRIAGGQDFRWIFIIYLWPWWQRKATRLVFYQGGCGSWIICNEATAQQPIREIKKSKHVNWKSGMPYRALSKHLYENTINTLRSLFRYWIVLHSALTNVWEQSRIARVGGVLFVFVGRTNIFLYSFHFSPQSKVDVYSVNENSAW